MVDHDIDAALQQDLQAQQQYFADNCYPSAAERKATLAKLLAMVVNNKDRICDAISQDFGERSKEHSLLVDVFPSQETLKHAMSHLSRWMRPKSRSVPLFMKFGRAKLLPQPLGCTGIVVPWNYPLFLAVGPLAAALAAGNTAMVKMSEYTPAFSELFAKLIAENFAAEQVKVICGDAEVGNRFTQLPFDHILFTGSTRVGRIVMRNASENLTPVTLELGGKSPVIIDRDYSLRKAVDAIINGKIINAGQTCIAPDYVYVHRSQQESFIALAKKATDKCLGNGEGYTSIIQDSHYQRLEALIADAKEKGAAIIPLSSQQHQPQQRKFMPLAVNQVSGEMRLMEEEIFGPILPIIVFDDLDEVLKEINAGPRPLALYLFSRDKTVQQKVLKQTHSGGVTINDMMIHVAVENLPFGGVGDSGMGHYHGESGFRTFSKEKAIFIQSRFSALSIVRLPFEGLSKRIIQLMVKD